MSESCPPCSGNFLNHVHLSPPGAESRAFAIRDDDPIPLSIDFRGGEAVIFSRERVHHSQARNVHLPGVSSSAPQHRLGCQKLRRSRCKSSATRLREEGVTWRRDYAPLNKETRAAASGVRPMLKGPSLPARKASRAEKNRKSIRMPPPCTGFGISHGPARSASRSLDPDNTAQHRKRYFAPLECFILIDGLFERSTLLAAIAEVSRSRDVSHAWHCKCLSNLLLGNSYSMSLCPVRESGNEPPMINKFVGQRPLR